MPVVLRATHTHLYPGARGTVGPGEPLRWSARARDVACVVELADGSTAAARLERFAEEGAYLCVEAYRTAAGTVIPRKRWLLELAWWESAVAGYRVRRRLPPAANGEEAGA